jgi:hypothetical protein
MEGITFASNDLDAKTGPGQATTTDSSATGAATGDETYTREPGV